MSLISLKKFTIHDGQLLGARFVQSPNHNPRPVGVEIDLIVIHNISLPPGEFGGPHIESFFTNTLDFSLHPYFSEIAPLKVSSHCFINRQGEITQFVPFTDRAWHAGESIFEGKPNCNDYSIGIELEGADDVPYTDNQYHSLSNLVVLLQKTYPRIIRNRIVGHSTIAPGRKTDPGPAFDWSLLTSILDEKQATLYT